VWNRRQALGLALLAAVSIGTVSIGAAPQEQGRDLLDKLSYPKTVIVVRHAEKAAEPKADPVLSEEGVARAQRLAALLAKSGVTHLYASEFQRTQQTLAPLALATGAKVSIAKAADLDAARSAIETLPRNSVTVIAAHSNTAPTMVELLTGGQTKVAMNETEYDRLFVVTQWGPGTQSTCIEMRY
jgi:phosphohistidine phosphatase SixA